MRMRPLSAGFNRVVAPAYGGSAIDHDAGARWARARALRVQQKREAAAARAAALRACWNALPASIRYGVTFLALGGAEVLGGLYVLLRGMFGNN